VFDLTTGSRVAIVRVPIPFENVAVDGSWMAGLTFDGLGVASLHRWSIQPALDAIAEAAAGGVD